MAETPPEGFSVEQESGVVTIRWGSGRKAQGVAGLVVPFALAVLFVCALGGLGADRAGPLIFAGALLVWTLYRLLVVHVRRTTIQAGKSRWEFSRRLLPVHDPDFQWFRWAKTVDPTQYGQITSSAVAQDSGAFGELLVALLSSRWYRQDTQISLSYGLTLKSDKGRSQRVLSRLEAEQAAYLAKVLQPLLAGEASVPGRSEAPKKGLWWLPDQKKGEKVRRATSAPQIQAGSGDGSASTVEPGWVACAACSASNPADSAFCGECGASLSTSSPRL